MNILSFLFKVNFKMNKKIKNIKKHGVSKKIFLDSMLGVLTPFFDQIYKKCTEGGV